MIKIKDDSEILAKLVTKAMEDKKAEEIVSVDLRKLHAAVSKFFVICHAQSSTQVQAIADNIEEEVKKTLGYNPFGVEGKQNAEWVLIDYSNVVAHIFNAEKREFYQLEKLWADGAIKKTKTKVPKKQTTDFEF